MYIIEERSLDTGAAESQRTPMRLQESTWSRCFVQNYNQPQQQQQQQQQQQHSTS